MRVPRPQLRREIGEVNHGGRQCSECAAGRAEDSWVRASLLQLLLPWNPKCRERCEECKSRKLEVCVPSERSSFPSVALVAGALNFV